LPASVFLLEGRSGPSLAKAGIAVFFVLLLAAVGGAKVLPAVEDVVRRGSVGR
jgi:hypothetical protein